MTVFILSTENAMRIREAAERARANPIPLAVVMHMAEGTSEDDRGVIRGERPPSALEPQSVELPLGWRVAISCEEQPSGLVLHLSVSTPTPKLTVPLPEVMRMIVRAAGAGPMAKVWPEEFLEDGKVAGTAVNVLCQLYTSQDDLQKFTDVLGTMKGVGQ